MSTRDFLARYVAKIDYGDGTSCWVWTGARRRHAGRLGVGQLHTGLATVDAHALAWILEHRVPVPPRLHVAHTCGEPACVRPDHLEVTSRRRRRALTTTTAGTQPDVEPARQQRDPLLLLGLSTEAARLHARLTARLADLADAGRAPVCTTDPWAWSADAPVRVRAEAADACLTSSCALLELCARFAAVNGERHGVWGSQDLTGRRRSPGGTPGAAPTPRAAGAGAAS